MLLWIATIITAAIVLPVLWRQFRSGALALRDED